MSHSDQSADTGPAGDSGFHQDEGVDLRFKTLWQFGHPSEKSPTVLVLAVDGLPAIPSAEHIIPAVRNVKILYFRAIRQRSRSLPQLSQGVV